MTDPHSQRILILDFGSQYTQLIARRVRASEVLGPRGLLLIEHEGEVYTLRLTRNNRLILTK